MRSQLGWLIAYRSQNKDKAGQRLAKNWSKQSFVLSWSWCERRRAILCKFFPTNLGSCPLLHLVFQTFRLLSPPSYLLSSFSLLFPLCLCVIHSPPTPFPHHTSPTMFFSNIYLLFLGINCTVLYSGINSRNTVTVNNLLSVWEKASEAPICRGLESNLPAMSQVAFSENSGLAWFVSPNGCGWQNWTVAYTAVSWPLMYRHRFSLIITALIILKLTLGVSAVWAGWLWVKICLSSFSNYNYLTHNISKTQTFSFSIMSGSSTVNCQHPRDISSLKQTETWLTQATTKILIMKLKIPTEPIRHFPHRPPLWKWSVIRADSPDDMTSAEITLGGSQYPTTWMTKGVGLYIMCGYITRTQFP